MRGLPPRPERPKWALGQRLALPPRRQLEGDEIKVFTPEQLAAVIDHAPERHRLLLELLAATGLRISEAIALHRLHVQLEGPEPEVCVRRALVRGRIEPPRPSTAAARSACPTRWR